MSYLNLFDAAAAWSLVHDLEQMDEQSLDGVNPAVAIIKHANPCGAAVGDDLAETYQRAYECDPRSAFGGIVASNRPIDLGTVARIEEAAQADLIIAPGYDEGVIERIRSRRKNTRILEAPVPSPSGLALRAINGGWLVQAPHAFSATPGTWQVVTKRQPSDAEWADAAFAWRVCGHVSSNAIVLARNGTAWGIGAGQQNRVEAGQIAAAKAGRESQGRRLCVRRLLSVPGRDRSRCVRRDQRGHPARWFDRRRRSDRQGRRARSCHDLYRGAPVQALASTKHRVLSTDAGSTGG